MNSRPTFTVLGPLEVAAGSGISLPAAPKVRRVLSLLLLRANHVVSTAALIEELWGDEPPRCAMTTAQTYVYQLRRAFAASPRWADALVTRAPGYVLQVPPEELDAHLFARLVDEAAELVDRGELTRAAERLRAALARWRGPALAGVCPGRLVEGQVAQLHELRIRALELLVRAEGRLGRHRELIPALRNAVAAYPLNEWFHGRLIDALHQSGRRGEALAAYDHVRRVLDDELGLDPAPYLQRLQHVILAGPSRWDGAVRARGGQAVGGRSA